jgi:hypothetical protein
MGKDNAYLVQAPVKFIENNPATMIKVDDCLPDYAYVLMDDINKPHIKNNITIIKPVHLDTIKDEYKIGDKVNVVGYNDLLFRITDTQGDLVTAVTTIRHSDLFLTVPTKKLRTVKKEPFLYTGYQDKIPDNFLVIDGNYFEHLMTSSECVVKLLIRIKFLVRNHLPVWYGKTNKYIRAVFKLFALPVTEQLIDTGVYFSNKPFVNKSDYTLFISYKNSFIRRDYNTKTEVIGDLVTYYNNHRQSPLEPIIKNKSISHQRINFLLQKHTKVPQTDKIEQPLMLNIEDTINRIKQANWVWLYENIDFYLKIIRG